MTLNTDTNYPFATPPFRISQLKNQPTHSKTQPDQARLGLDGTGPDPFNAGSEFSLPAPLFWGRGERKNPLSLSASQPVPAERENGRGGGVLTRGPPEKATVWVRVERAATFR
jgi:hypothetical protein